MQPRLVDRQATLHAIVAELLQCPIVGVDTESDSLYRYHERVCLIQLSTPQADYVVDALAVDMRPLGALFGSDSVEKVFHAAEYDVMCLKRDYGFGFSNLFDTMLASRILGVKQFGLSALLRDHLGVALNKSMQRADWGARPLCRDKLRYAAMDSHYLPELRDILLGRLQANERLWAQARDGFEALCRLNGHQRRFDPEGYLRLPGARQLEATEASVLRELYLWREETARSSDTPPFRIVSNEALMKLAMLQPRSEQALSLLQCAQAGRVMRHLPEVLQAIARGADAVAEGAHAGNGRGRAPRR